MLCSLSYYASSRHNIMTLRRNCVLLRKERAGIYVSLQWLLIIIIILNLYFYCQQNFHNIYFIYKASSGVNCGSHFAVSCNRCANGRQSQRQAKHWCKGECTWDPYSNIIGGCIKKFGKLYTSITVR